jgi:hypothetical protein
MGRRSKAQWQAFLQIVRCVEFASVLTVNFLRFLGIPSAKKELFYQTKYRKFFEER